MQKQRSSIRNGKGGTEKAAPRLSSVANAMRLLKSFGEADSALGIGTLATRLGLAKSTVHRLAVTLVQAGMLEQTMNGKYQLGITVFELGSRARRQIDFYNEAKDVLRALREKTGESVNLAILRGEHVVYLNSLESGSAIKVAAPLGKRVPAHACVEGKVLLAFSEAQAVERVIRHGQGVGVSHPLADADGLRAELATIAVRGYGIGHEEADMGVRAIAAPFFGVDNDVAGAIGIAGPAARLNRRSLMSFLPALSQSVESLSGRLGASRPVTAGLRLVRA